MVGVGGRVGKGYERKKVNIGERGVEGVRVGGDWEVGSMGF